MQQDVPWSRRNNSLQGKLRSRRKLRMRHSNEMQKPLHSNRRHVCQRIQKGELMNTPVEFALLGSFYGLQKWVRTDIFWIENDSLELHATRYIHTTSFSDLSHMD